MSRENRVFEHVVKVSQNQLSDYEESKNQDYTRDFLGNMDAILSDFKRQNYFLLMHETFQTKQDNNFSDAQIQKVKLKIQQEAKSEQVANLIQAIGGQAFQAPLNVLEFQHFRHEGEAIAAIAKFDFSVYFQCGEELRYVTLNFAYGIKNLSTDRNYILNGKTRTLFEISDRECQILSETLNVLSNDVQRNFGHAIDKINPSEKTQSSAERAARNISLAFKLPGKVELISLMEVVETEIGQLLREYLEHRCQNWSLSCKAILGGGDYMAFFQSWNQEEPRCPETEVLRDLLESNTRAIRQIELVLGKNTDAIQNLFMAEETPIRALEGLKISLDASEKSDFIQRVFNKRLKIELKNSEYFRERISAKSLGRARKFLLGYLVGERDSSLSEGEFSQWVIFTVSYCFEHLKSLALIRHVRVRDFYKAQFLPKIEQEKERIIFHRSSGILKILTMNLNFLEISVFWGEMLREAEDIFMESAGLFKNVEQAFFARYSHWLSGSRVPHVNLDELIYRLTYMKLRDPAHSPYITIILSQAIHYKISCENGCSRKSLDVRKEILEKAEQEVEFQIKVQEAEKEKSLFICNEIRQKAAEFLNSSEGTENYLTGRVLSHLAEDMSGVVRTHYKNHYLRFTERDEAPKDRIDLMLKINHAIDTRLASESALRNFEGARERIKIYVLNVVLLVFTLGIFPLTRKFILKKPAFFNSRKNEIAENARLSFQVH